MFNVTKSAFVVFVVALLGFSSASFAQTKVAVIDINTAILNTDVAQKRIQELRDNSAFAELQAQLESVTKELQRLQEDKEKNEMTWNNEQQAEFAKQRDYKLADRKLIIEKLQSEDRDLSRKIMEDLGPKAQKALQSLIEEENIDIVLRAENNVLFASEAYDITAKLTDRVNKQK